jgi:phosphoglycolate phosphatase-like HAD superfamily hydrolase
LLLKRASILAGIKTVAVTYGYGKVAQDWGYDYLVDYPQDIQRLMENLQFVFLMD